ncbi:MAG: hypothetical protein ACI9CF_001369 [Candidatus Omnitrophota bacterium]|jgi:hypothetical protein
MKCALIIRRTLFFTYATLVIALVAAEIADLLLVLKEPIEAFFKVS